jgi:hypothetical protein
MKQDSNADIFLNKQISAELPTALYKSVPSVELNL